MFLKSIQVSLYSSDMLRKEYSFINKTKKKS